MTAARPVRVTLEATARPVTKRGRLLIEHGGGSFLIDPKAPDVVVEDLTPRHVWTDGDVLLNSAHDWTLTRHRGRWVLSTGKDPWEDADVDMALTDPTDPYCGELIVLRHQAGAA